jgi:hypothetical protein
MEFAPMVGMAAGAAVGGAVGGPLGAAAGASIGGSLGAGIGGMAIEQEAGELERLQYEQEADAAKAQAVIDKANVDQELSAVLGSQRQWFAAAGISGGPGSTADAFLQRSRANAASDKLLIDAGTSAQTRKLLFAGKIAERTGSVRGTTALTEGVGNAATAYSRYRATPKPGGAP